MTCKSYLAIDIFWKLALAASPISNSESLRLIMNVLRMDEGVPFATVREDANNAYSNLITGRIDNRGGVVPLCFGVCSRPLVLVLPF